MNEIQQALADLQGNLPNLSAKDQAFAASLLAQSLDRGLSEKQMFWVRKLAANEAPKAPVTISNFSAVIDLFNVARTHLKFPKVRMELEGHRPVVLSMAGAQAKHPGTINVTDGGKFPSNLWYGRVGADGAWNPSGKVDAPTMTSLTALLTAFAANPAGVAGVQGRAMKSCCFCARDLTDPRSRLVGYGPICAGHYNLPWGEI